MADPIDVTGQLGAVKPHVARAANTIANALGITRMSGFGQRSGVSDHPRGLAIDIPAGKAAGDQVAAFVTGNAGALGVKYVIWQQAMWKPQTGTWAPMAAKGGDTGSGYDPNHLRHVHVSFTDAAPAEDQASALERLIGTVAGPGLWVLDQAGNLITGAGEAAASLISDPLGLSAAAADARKVALQLAFVIAGLGLIVLGVNRLVVPQITKAIGEVL